MLTEGEWAAGFVGAFIGGFASAAFGDLRRWWQKRRKAPGTGKEL